MYDCDFPEMELDGYIRHLRDDAYDKKIPFKGVFELTPRCNFNCNMCYVHLKPEEMPAVGKEFTADEWIRIAREAQRSGTLELTLTGGEPFVRQDFREIYEAVHDMGFLIQIFSNGYMIDEETVRWLKKRPPRTMRFTLYGASDESYEKVCGIKGGFTKVKHSVRLLKEAGIPLYLVATLTKENEQDIDDIYRFAFQNRIPITHTSSLINPVRGATADAKAHQLARELPPAEVIRQIRERNKGRYPRKPCTDFLEVCNNYRTGYWVTWNGKMQLCAFLTEPSVPVSPGTFLQSWKELLDELSSLRQPVQCETCKYERYCERCPGVLYAETGENGIVTEEYCRQAEFNYLLYGKPIEEMHES